MKHETKIVGKHGSATANLGVPKTLGHRELVEWLVGALKVLALWLCWHLARHGQRSVSPLHHWRRLSNGHLAPSRLGKRDNSSLEPGAWSPSVSGVPALGSGAQLAAEAFTSSVNLRLPTKPLHHACHDGFQHQPTSAAQELADFKYGFGCPTPRGIQSCSSLIY